MANLEYIYLKNAELSARLSELETRQPNTVEFQAGESLVSMAIHSLKITHNVSNSFETIYKYKKFVNSFLRTVQRM